MSVTKRIFLIHATAVAITPINQAFARLWPEAELVNLLEDSLSKDLAAAGRLTDELKKRFLDLASYAVSAGADGILFTCSAFGEAIARCQRELPIPILKPNEAMIEEAMSGASNLAVVATFEPAISSMLAEFQEFAAEQGRDVRLVSYTCPEAFKALQSGDVAKHDQIVADLVAGLDGVERVCFAQFSMVTALDQAQKNTSILVLATPDSAVMKLRRSLSA